MIITIVGISGFQSQPHTNLDSVPLLKVHTDGTYVKKSWILKCALMKPDFRRNLPS